MLSAQQLDKYADVLIWGMETARKSMGGKFKQGDIVHVSYGLAALDLAEILHKKLVQKKYNVMLRMSDTPKIELDFFTHADKNQIKFLAPWSKNLYANLNGSINLSAPVSLTHLVDVDSKKLALSALVRKPLVEIMDKREAEGKFGWTLCIFPTKALAKKAKISIEKYEKEIVTACYLNKPNPVKIWEDLYKNAKGIKHWLDNLNVDYFHIKSKNVDLKIKAGVKRKWLGMSGHNIPSFEIFTSPDFRGTEGVYYANIPALKSGNLVQGAKLYFKNGRVVKMEAKKGLDFLKKQLSMDKGAKQVGEFSLTDKRFSPINRFMANTLFDENIGGNYGNCHIALGSSFPEAYTGNVKKLNKTLKEKLGFNDSALHWDLINTEKKEVWAHLKSGQKVLIYKDGIFKN